MREIVIISGKGGTGKTSLCAAFAHLAKNKIVCDLDVDVPDLHILLRPERLSEEDFVSGNQAVIDESLCESCGLCHELCRFSAIRQSGRNYAVDPLRCEGCMVCLAFCPAKAIAFPARHCGQWFVSSTRFGTLVHAELIPGAENSGRLVALLKQKARAIAKAEGLELILCDGSPGIGCPVISSLSGADLAVIVTEPTPSGRHDLERVADVCAHFRVKAAIIVNKFDLNLEETGRIEEYCRKSGHELAAKLPYHSDATRAMIERLAVTELAESEFKASVRQAWEKIEKLSTMAANSGLTSLKGASS